MASLFTCSELQVIGRLPYKPTAAECSFMFLTQMTRPLARTKGLVHCTYPRILRPLM